MRQGDTIQWVVGQPGPPHQVRFGANGVTSVADINTILENITPALSLQATVHGFRHLLTAQVKDDAEPGKTFIFTCGVHPGPMLSLPFTVCEGRRSTAPDPQVLAEAALHWHVHVDTTP